jgi:hypothetical protein
MHTELVAGGHEQKGVIRSNLVSYIRESKDNRSAAYIQSKVILAL